jgi:hypothetical protein
MGIWVEGKERREKRELRAYIAVKYKNIKKHQRCAQV